MKRIQLLVAAASSAVAVFSASAANAIVIDIEYGFPTGPGSHTQDGFTFSNSSSSDRAYGNWLILGNPQFNANGTNATIFQNFPGTTNTITQVGGGAFSFQSIGLANIYNNTGDTGGIDFTFNYFGGGSSTTSVNLPGTNGLQTYTFNENNLASVQFTPATTQGRWIQFDNVGVNGAVVPEPATWAMMIIGFGAASSMIRRRKAVVA